MNYWISASTGAIYEGDCQPGDIAPTPAQVAAWQAQVAATLLRAQAQALLTASDIQVVRCVESGTALPAAWVTYRSSLRSIVSGGTGTLPTRPDWP